VVIPPEAIRTAQSNPWPGNVRELAAAVHDAVGRGGGTGIAISALGAAPHAAVGMGLGFPAVLPTLDEARDQLVAEALRRTAGDLVEASRLLGMSRWGLSKRVRQTQTDRISRPA
jgi:DNA-binding NtrC family response regulator